MMFASAMVNAVMACGLVGAVGTAPADDLPTLHQAEPAVVRSRPGVGYDLTYRWDAAPMNGDYKVFVHIVDASGRIVEKDNHQPPRPTSSWSGPIEYRRTVHLPKWKPVGDRSLPGLPEGEYKIFAGLADDAGTMQPLHAGEGVVESEGPRYRIGTLIVDEDAPLPTLGEPTLDLSDYEVTFEENFDELKVLAWGPIEEGGARWIAHTPYRGDFGDAAFADPQPDFPFTVEDGILTITARKVGSKWQSGLLSSIDQNGNGFAQKYGYFEMRGKLPEGAGAWSAFWLHAQPRVTRAADKSLTFIEIDILEQYGHYPNKLSTALHLWRRDGGPSKHMAERHLVTGMAEDFHTYGAMVTPQHIIWYFDGVELRREPMPESGHVPLYVMVNLALGPGWPLDKTPNPSRMLVDYIKVYQKK